MLEIGIPLIPQIASGFKQVIADVTLRVQTGYDHLMSEKDDTGKLLNEVLAMEHRVWLALTLGDASEDRALLSDDFLGVYASGFADCSEHAAQLETGPSVSSYQLRDVRVMPVGADHALLSYLARYRPAGASQDKTMYVSSLWRREPVGWKNIFSQDTLASN